MEDRRIPSLLLSIMMSQVDEMLGRRSLLMLLRQSELSEYIDHRPRMDQTPSITVGQYSQLLANIYEMFGARDAGPILLRSGRLGAAELRRHRPAQFTIAGTALKLLPTALRMQWVLSRLAEQGEDLYGTPHHLHDEGDSFVLEMPGCPHCAELTRRSVAENRPVTRPVCHIPLAVIEEMVEWITGQKHLVKETECIATGAPACRFRVAR